MDKKGIVTGYWVLISRGPRPVFWLLARRVDENIVP
jgi:hypothetical protein